jgi:4-hydroxy-tetrahydrodipicolinate synthase
MNNSIFSGSLVALVTPFVQGTVDTAALEKLVEWHLQEGSHGLVALGSTGEGALVTPAERQHILATIIKTANGQIPVIAGCGSPSTDQAITMAGEAQTLGATAALVVTPYYVKPSPEGIFHHFQAIANACPLPMIVYNNPARCGVDLSVDLVTRLATVPTIIGLKDSHTDLTRVQALRQAISKPFCLLSGEDHTSGSYLAQGGDGWISTIGNIAPRLCSQMTTSWHTQNLPEFAKICAQLAPLYTALQTDVNPCPIKYGVSLLGKCRNELRLPLLPVSKINEQLIFHSMTHAGLLDGKKV